MPRQTIMRQKPPKYATAFILCCWAQGQLLHVVCISSETPLEKTILSFASGYQLEIASWLGIGACVHFTSEHWNLIWLGHVETANVFATTLFVSSFVCWSCCE